jgi:hypothetical protein
VAGVAVRGHKGDMTQCSLHIDRIRGLNPSTGRVTGHRTYLHFEKVTERDVQNIDGELEDI